MNSSLSITYIIYTHLSRQIVIACFMIQCRIELEKARLLVLEAADQLDRLGNKKARGTIAMAKVNTVVCEVQGRIRHAYYVS